MAEERILTIPLRAAKRVPRNKRAPRAMKEIRQFISRHMKASDEQIWIHDNLNEYIWARGIQKPPSKVKVLAIHNDLEDFDIIEVKLYTVA